MTKKQTNTASLILIICGIVITVYLGNRSASAAEATAIPPAIPTFRPSATPVTPSASPMPSDTPTATVPSTDTLVPSATPTTIPSDTLTQTPIASPTATFTSTDISTATDTASATITLMPSVTQTITATKLIAKATRKSVVHAQSGCDTSNVIHIVSVASDGTQANDGPVATSPAPISGNGRYVAMNSNASNLVSGDVANTNDVFEYDTQTCQMSLASANTSGMPSNATRFGSLTSAVSGDGRYVAFESNATNLVAGDTNGVYDVFVRDMQTNQTTRVSVSSAGVQANGRSDAPALSYDGRYVAFQSDATNLVAGDTNGTTDLFVRDMQTGQITRISVATNGTQGNGASFAATISADGMAVVFTSNASNLVAGDTNAQMDIFFHNMTTGETKLVSKSTAGTIGNNYSYFPAISGDGRYVGYLSVATNLIANDTNGQGDTFLTDMNTGTTVRVSVATDGTQQDGFSFYGPAISNDGRYITFNSSSDNLVSGDTNAKWDVFVHDQQTGQTILVSVASDGTQGNDNSVLPSISADGSRVSFLSSATNLITGTTVAAGGTFVAPVVFPVLPPPTSTPTDTPVPVYSITRLVWNNVYASGGTTPCNVVSCLKQDARFNPIDPSFGSPSFCQKISKMQTPWNSGNTQYGEILVGYLVPPGTGTYTFYLESSADSELDIDTHGTSPQTDFTLALTPGQVPPTGSPDWNSPFKTSAAIPSLQANMQYAFIVYHQYSDPAHNVGLGDDLVVGWSGPGISGTQIIDGANFAPYNPPICIAPTATLVSTGVTATPTPTKTMTPTSTYTLTPSRTFTPTPTKTMTHTSTNTPSPTPSPTPTSTNTPSPTSTASSTPTPSPTPTETPTETVTETNTATPTPTATATQTDTPTATLTATITPSRTVTPSAAPRPTTPTVNSPSGSISSATPTFTWNAVNYATSYSLLLVPNNDFRAGQTYTFAADKICSGGVCSVVLNTVLADGNYAWSVAGINSSGAGASSVLLSFSVNLPVPGQVTTIGPTGDVNTDRPTFTWNADPYATTYLLWIDNTATGAAVKQSFAASAICSGGTCTAALDGLLPGGLFSWWVRADNVRGSGSWSVGKTFNVTVAAAPITLSAPTLVAPTGSISTHTPAFTWDVVSGATQYYVWVYNAPHTFSFKRVYDAASNCGATTCSITLTTALANDHYTWWVQAQTAVNTGPWSIGLSFSIP